MPEKKTSPAEWLLLIISDQLKALEYEQISSDSWEEIKTLAIREALGPLLYWRISEILPGQKLSIPFEALSDLKLDFIQSSAKNEMVRKRFADIRALSSRQGIDVLALKGADLAFWLYADPALRPMSDIDVLVKPGDFRQLVISLKSCGYSLERVSHHATLSNRSNPSQFLEIHWSLPGATPVPTWFFDEKEKAITHILYSTAHIELQHPSQVRLLWLFDLYQLIKQLPAGSNNQALIERARELKWDSMVSSTLTKVEQVFNLHDQDNQSDRAENPQPVPETLISATWKTLGLLPLPTRLHAIFRLFFPTLHYMSWKYNSLPSWKLPLSYPKRWQEILFNKAGN